MSFAGAMVLALLIDCVIGWPDALYRRVGHPVSWIGRAISWGERVWNTGPERQRRWAGVGLTGLVVAGLSAVGWAVQATLPDGWLGTVVLGVLAWPLVAARSLHAHVARVAAPLAKGDLDGARGAVSMIVGRTPKGMDAPAISRAAIESLAENASDGVVAPLFWGAIFGLPGIVAYKGINTLDSMIGYRNARYLAFGWAAARLDDLANLVPARLTGVLFVAVARGVRGPAFRTMRRDARQHRSPNAGWPEAAMAGALAVRLSGPRVYDGVTTDDAWLNPVAGDPDASDILRALRLYRRMVGLFAVLLLLAWVV